MSIPSTRLLFTIGIMLFPFLLIIAKFIAKCSENRKTKRPTKFEMQLARDADEFDKIVRLSEQLCKLVNTTYNYDDAQNQQFGIIEQMSAANTSPQEKITEK